MARKYSASAKRSSKKTFTKKRREIRKIDKMFKRTKKAFKRIAKKKEPLFQGVKQLTTFHSTSKHSYGHRPLNMQGAVFKNSTHANWSSVTQIAFKSSTGRQECVDAVICDQYDIDILKSEISKYMASGFSNVQMNTLRWLLRSFRVRYELKNFGKDSAYVDIYDVLPRRDIGFDDNGPQNSPTIAFSQGVKDQVSVFDNTMYRRPGQTPFDSKQFVTFYKVHKVTRVILSPGGTHEHIVSGHPNYIFDYSQVVGTSGQIKGFRGLTAYSMFILRGSICLADDATPTYEPAELAVIGSKEIEYSFTNTPVNITHNTYSLGTTVFSGVNMVNPDTGILDTFATVT